MEFISNKSHLQLLQIIRSVRNRWRLKIALHGAALVIGGGLAVFLLSAVALNQFSYTPSSIMVFRLVAYLAILALLMRFVVVPLLPRITDERVALYIEETDPSLQAAILSAVEIANSPVRTDREQSPQLMRQVVEVATQKVKAMDDGRIIEQKRLYRSYAFLGGAIAAFVAALLFGPDFFARSAKLLIQPFTTAEAATPYTIGIEPGNATIARGGDQEISAVLNGFGSERVELAYRKGANGDWQRLSMAPQPEKGGFVFRLFDVDEETEYYVEASGIKSETFTISVADLPAVKQLDLEYIFPQHTGLSPITEKDGGDIAAIVGTTVNITVQPTMETKGGRIIIEGGPTVQLTPGDSGTLTGSIKVEKDGFYRIELRAKSGEMVKASLDYTIDVIKDHAPTVKFIKPGKDTRVSSLEEVFAEASAQDDFGVAKLELLYSVNGGEEKTVVLFSDASKRLPEVAAGHTFMLEDFKLEPGDLVSYYARATDNKTDGAQTAASDIYFMTVRPFDRTYRQGEAPPPPPPGAGGGAPPQQQDGNLSQRQKDIIAATFKIIRDKATFTAKEMDENIATIKLSQERLHEEVDELTTRMVERGVASSDSNLLKVSKLLPLAAKEMEAAEKLLGDKKSQEALAPENKSLVQLQRAEAVYREYTVQQQQQQQGGRGGGGGGGQQNPEDLADLFELQRDLQRNQYETVDRAQQAQQQAEAAQAQAAAEVDAVAEQLKKLAARLQADNARERALADSLQRSLGRAGGGGSGGGSQRQLAAQADSMARQLEKLARERNSTELQDAARNMQQAADALTRSAAAGSDRANADAQRALAAMEETRRLLEGARESRPAEGTQSALENLQNLQAQQRAIANATDRLMQQELNAPNRAQQEQDIAARKEQLAQGVNSLQNRLDRMAMDTRRDQREASRQLQGAADAVRENRIPDRIRQTQGLLHTTDRTYMGQEESRIAAGLDDVEQRLQAAGQAMTGSPTQQANQIVDAARNLSRGAQSLAERIESMRQQNADSNRRLQEGQAGEGKAGEGKAGEGKAGEGKAGEGKAGDGKAGDGKAGEGKAGEGKGGEGKAGEGKGGEGKAGEGKGGEGKAGEGKGGEGKAGEGKGGEGKAGEGKGGEGKGGEGKAGEGKGGEGKAGDGKAGGEGKAGEPGRRLSEEPGRRGGGGASGGPSGDLINQRPTGSLTLEQRRQAEREFAQQIASGQALSRQLRDLGTDSSRATARALDEVVSDMQQLEQRGALGDPKGIAELQASVVEGLKAVEFAVRRQLLNTSADKVFLGNKDEVPAGFEKQVQEYFKVLSKTPPPKTGGSGGTPIPPP